MQLKVAPGRKFLRKESVNWIDYADRAARVLDLDGERSPLVLAAAIRAKAGLDPIKRKTPAKVYVVKWVRGGCTLSSGKIDTFFSSAQWLKIRMEVIERDKATCQACGRTRKDGVILQVDHIRPRSRYPELALDITNLQCLCRDCNMGKSTKTINFQD
jgi:hypothetical protein